MAGQLDGPLYMFFPSASAPATARWSIEHTGHVFKQGYQVAWELCTAVLQEFVLTKEKQEAERKRIEAQGIADFQVLATVYPLEPSLQKLWDTYQEYHTSPYCIR